MISNMSVHVTAGNLLNVLLGDFSPQDFRMALSTYMVAVENTTFKDEIADFDKKVAVIK